MRHSNPLVIPVMLLIFVLHGPTNVLFGQLYHVTDLGRGVAYGINNGNQIVGVLGSEAFLYSGGVTSSLGTGGYDSIAQAINNNGQIVGLSLTNVSGTFVNHAVQFSNGMLNDLGTLSGSAGSSDATGINDQGQIAGTTSISDGSVSHAFLYSNGTMQDLGTLPGGNNSTAAAINNNGLIIGQSGSSTGEFAFQYSNGTMTSLGTLPGGNSSAAQGLNSSGQIVGQSGTSGTEHAFLYSTGTMHDLGAPSPDEGSGALAINDLGQVVGRISSNDFGFRAMLYNNGTMYDLNDRLDSSGVGWTLTEATAINNYGWIIGVGVAPGGAPNALGEAFLLTPSSLVLAAMGFSGLAAWGWRRRKRLGLL